MHVFTTTHHLASHTDFLVVFLIPFANILLDFASVTHVFIVDRLMFLDWRRLLQMTSTDNDKYCYIKNHHGHHLEAGTRNDDVVNGCRARSFCNLSTSSSS